MGISPTVWVSSPNLNPVPRLKKYLFQKSTASCTALNRVSFSIDTTVTEGISLHTLDTGKSALSAWPREDDGGLASTLPRDVMKALLFIARRCPSAYGGHSFWRNSLIDFLSQGLGVKSDQWPFCCLLFAFSGQDRPPRWLRRPTARTLILEYSTLNHNTSMACGR